MTDELDLLAATAGDLFASVRRGDAPDESSGALWKALDAQGMTRVSAPEPYGAGESIAFLATLLQAAGRAAVSVPLIETHVASSALAAAGGPDEGGATALAIDPALFDDTRPPAGHIAVYAAGLGERVVALRADGIGARVDVWRWDRLGLEVSRNVAGEPVALLDLAAAPEPEWSGELEVTAARSAAEIEVLGRALLLAGAGQRALDQTLEYVGQREQFGRTLAAFQSVQQSVAIMASQVAAASVSGSAAVAVVANPAHDPDAARFCVLACRAQADGMAAYVGRAAHQLHGAIGFTQEHSLRFATTRLAAWRAHVPLQADVEKMLGRLVVRSGEVWPLVTGFPNPR
jgi:acyl-CoA dehydrogenase